MITPTTEQELSEAIRSQCGPLCVTGGGTRWGGPCAGDRVSTQNLSGVTLYEPGALTLVVAAGTPLAEVDALLAAEGQRLAFEPMDHRAVLGTDGTPTIGGVVAANVSGPRRVQVGACRDHLLGVRFVDGEGRVIRNGGRVMKNVTGYDLVKLMAGSHGTLGILTEVSLKALPVPEHQGTLRIDASDAGTALRLMQAAMMTPFEVTGAVWQDGAVLLRVEGFEAQVAYRLAELQSRFGGAPDDVDWTEIRDLRMMADLPVLWRVSLRPSRMGAFLDAIDAQCGSRVVLDWGGGLGWIGFSADHLEQAETYGNGISGAEVIRTNMHDTAAKLGGHATLIKGDDALFTSGPVFQPELPAVKALSDGLRRTFDPRGIFNRGRMG